MALFREMSAEQRRQLTDVDQLFETYREAIQQFGHSYDGAYVGTMRWIKVGQTEYLYRTYNNIRRSLGPRSEETERIKEDYMRHRGRLRARITTLEKRMKEMAPANRAMRIARVPAIASRVLRQLDKSGLLGKNLFVVGTNSLYAYEARSGIFFPGPILATRDADLLVDARRGLSVALFDIRKEGILGLLKKVDRSFSKEKSYSAVNDDGYKIDLICPQDKDFLQAPAARLGESVADIEPAPVEGLQWLRDAPRFEATVVGDDGVPLYMPCTDPRVYALHKMWMSRRLDRDSVKKRRDAEQAVAVAALCKTHLNLDFYGKDLSAMPESIYGHRAELTKAAASLVADA